ncbi:hypothetical protein PPL_08593 [Heterostelium album PN500]|uniref:Ankyrin repeat protein n=1 Tax=Heterostelium pallidum (strain ATCC 26659 / Pp 5 / PN500) TaxID=670386 RepID=D3BJ68_HETP5|nr:hypothetical protein PPL_08593 [Heterostelium album PN500]EFA77948.1 hypothetical protein PPL_08593 [Heterostelium album PN500]|eukprot:XP_020430076.1 hypothetical protein PPL_08593 [Heterostelium album PN500]
MECQNNNNSNKKDFLFKRIFNINYLRCNIFDSVKSIHSILGKKSYCWQKLPDFPNLLLKYRYYEEFVEHLNYQIDLYNCGKIIFELPPLSYNEYSFGDKFDDYQTDRQRREEEENEERRKKRLKYKQYIKALENVLVWFAGNGQLDRVKFIIRNYQFYIDKICKEKSVEAACKYGHLEILMYFNRLPDWREYFKNAIDISAEFGHLECVKYLFKHNHHVHCAMDKASGHGYLDIVKFIHYASIGPYTGNSVYDYSDSSKRAGCSTMAINKAAMNGHLDVVEFLCENRSEGCGEEAINWAATVGNLSVVKYLHYKIGAPCFYEALDMAATNGYLGLVKFLHYNRTEGCSTSAIDGAARNGHLEILKFLHFNRTEGCTTGAFDNAARNGHLDILKFLHEYRDEGCSVMAANGAAFEGHLDVIEHLHIWNVEFTIGAMTNAAVNGHVGIVKFLHENRNEGCQQSTLADSARKGHLEVVKFIHYNRSECWTGNALEGAIECSKFEVAEFLHSKRIEGVTNSFITKVLKDGDLCKLKFIVENINKKQQVLDVYQTLEHQQKYDYQNIDNYIQKIHCIYLYTNLD